MDANEAIHWKENIKLDSEKLKETNFKMPNSFLNLSLRAAVA